MTATYATPLELARYLNIEQTIPARTPGATKDYETVGTGDDSTTQFDLDFAYIIAGSYTIYYGANTESLTALTETTHYTLDKDLGRITLTSAGVTAVGTDNIYAGYSYTQAGNGVDGLTNTRLQEALDRAQDQLDSDTGAHWADGTDATPDYNQVTNEKHSGKGRYLRDYFTKEYPLPDVSTTLDGDVTADDEEITVVSTDGFPSSGYISIGSDKIQYTGKTDTTFTGCTSVEAHSDGAGVYPFVIEISQTDEGTEPSWQVLNKDSEYDLDLSSGRIRIFNDVTNETYYSSQYPPGDIPNRFRITYIWGYETIPADVKRLCLMLAVKDLIHTTLRRDLLFGRDTTGRDNYNIDDEWIDSTIRHLKSYKITNV